MNAGEKHLLLQGAKLYLKGIDTISEAGIFAFSIRAKLYLKGIDTF